MGTIGAESDEDRDSGELTPSSSSGDLPCWRSPPFSPISSSISPRRSTQFFPRRDRHGRRAQRLSHRHPRGPWVPAHFRRGDSAAAGLALATVIALAVAGVGYFLFAGTHSFVGLIIPTLIASVGYHSWLQLQDALGLSLARQGEEGSVLGRFRSIGFAGTIVALLVMLAILLRVDRISGDLTTGAGAVAARSLRGDGGSALRRRGVIFRFPVSECTRRGPCRAAHHLAQGIPALLLARAFSTARACSRSTSPSPPLCWSSSSASTRSP